MLGAWEARLADVSAAHAKDLDGLQAAMLGAWEARLSEISTAQAGELEALQATTKACMEELVETVRSHRTSIEQRLGVVEICMKDVADKRGKELDRVKDTLRAERIETDRLQRKA